MNVRGLLRTVRVRLTLWYVLLLTVALIAVCGFLTDRPDFLDLALVYALMNFIGVIAVLRFVKFGHFGQPTDDTDNEASNP